jgi:hypothetical protein
MIFISLRMIECVANRVEKGGLGLALQIRRVIQVIIRKINS